MQKLDLQDIKYVVKLSKEYSLPLSEANDPDCRFLTDLRDLIWQDVTSLNNGNLRAGLYVDYRNIVQMISKYFELSLDNVVALPDKL